MKEMWNFPHFPSWAHPEFALGDPDAGTALRTSTLCQHWNGSRKGGGNSGRSWTLFKVFVAAAAGLD